MSKKTVHEILEDEDFKSLSSQKNTISVILTILELVLYFGFIALIAFNKPFLAQKMTEGRATTIGIPIAVGTILLSWVFTGSISSGQTPNTTPWSGNSKIRWVANDADNDRFFECN